MTQLRVGIIGLGVGENHIEGYRAHPGCKVIALCDFSEEKQAMAQQKYPELFTKMKTVIDEAVHTTII